MINVVHGYVYRPEDFEFIELVQEMISRSNVAGWRFVVVTNQSGIARGYDTAKYFEYEVYML